MQLQNQNCLEWLCVDLQNTTKATKWEINEGTEVFRRNVVLDVLRKILQTYIEVLQYSLLLRDNKVIVLDVLQNDVKYPYFKRNIFKNVLPNTF